MVKSVYQEINGWLHWGASCRIIWWQGLMTVQTELLPSKTLSRLSKCLLSGERLCLVDWFSFLETTVSFMRKEKHNYPLLVSLISPSLPSNILLSYTTDNESRWGTFLLMPWFTLQRLLLLVEWFIFSDLRGCKMTRFDYAFHVSNMRGNKT